MVMLCLVRWGIVFGLDRFRGGAVMVPALQSLGMRNQARINALSMGAISVMALSSTLFYAMTDQGDWLLLFSCLLPQEPCSDFGRVLPWHAIGQAVV